jgi:hypothetical protein
MRGLRLTGGAEPLQRLLVIGAHSDDIEIGCGGTIHETVPGLPSTGSCWRHERAQEARAAPGVPRAHEARISASFRTGFTVRGGR